eukprot:645995-Prymnesium_polylepis.1
MPEAEAMAEPDEDEHRRTPKECVQYAHDLYRVARECACKLEAANRHRPNAVCASGGARTRSE